MYSRYHNASQRPIRLPENYNGCAFSAKPPEEKYDAPKSQPPRQMEIGRPSSLPPIEERAQPKRPSEPPAEELLEAQKTSAPLLSAPLPGLFGGHGRPPSLLRGVGFEELLLLGLIVLLAGNEELSDIVLWLVLLLFCG